MCVLKTGDRVNWATDNYRETVGEVLATYGDFCRILWDGVKFTAHKNLLVKVNVSDFPVDTQPLKCEPKYRRDT